MLGAQDKWGRRGQKGGRGGPAHCWTEQLHARTGPTESPQPRPPQPQLLGGRQTQAGASGSSRPRVKRPSLSLQPATRQEDHLPHQGLFSHPQSPESLY